MNPMKKYTENEIPQKDRIFTDEEFLGIWDEKRGEWSIEPKLNYSLNEPMRDIEEKVKGRDWQGAKKALHQYFINTGRKYHNPSGRHTISADELALQMENIYSVIPPIGFGVVPVQTEDFSVNVTDTVRKMWENTSIHFSVMLMGRHKNEKAILCSRRGAFPPILKIKTEKQEYSFISVSDTYIQGGRHAEDNFGESEELYIQESGNPLNDEMMRTYIQFDFDEDIMNQQVLDARIILHGKNLTQHQMEIIAFCSEDVLVNEQNKTFSKSNIKVLSFVEQDDRYTGFDYKIPKRLGVDNQYFNIITRFWKAGGLLTEYERTKNEIYAERYIKECLNYYTSLGGGELLLEPKVRSTGGDTLNTGFRLQQTIDGYYSLVDSESMTPDSNLQLLKMFYDEREFIGDGRTFWTRFAKDCNWGITQTISHFYVCVYFPEFAETSEHLDEISRRMNYLMHSLILPDGTYVEATNGYPIHVLRDFQSYRSIMHKMQWDIPKEIDEQLRKFAYYFINCMEPSFYLTEYGDMHYKKDAALLNTCLYRLSELYEDNTLKYMSTQGKEGEIPRWGSSIYPNGKAAVFRTGWHEDDLFMFTNWRPYAVHSHNDALNMTLVAYGNRVLTDNSDRSYNDEPIANWQRKSRFSHNVCSIDDRTGYRGWGVGAENVQGDALSHTSGNLDIMDGWFTEKIEHIMQYHNRKILFLKPLRTFVVTDFLHSSEKRQHIYRQNWQFEPSSKVTVKKNMLQTHFETGGNVLIASVSPKEECRLNLQTSFHDSVTSRYGEYVVDTSSDSLIYHSVIYPYQGNDEVSVNIVPLDMNEGNDKVSAAEINMAINHGVQKGILFSSMEENGKEYSFGNYSTNARDVYIHGEDDISYVAINNGSVLSRNGKTFISTDKKAKCLSVIFKSDEIVISMSEQDAQEISKILLNVKMPPKTVLVNNNEVNYCIEKGMFVISL